MILGVVFIAMIVMLFLCCVHEPHTNNTQKTGNWPNGTIHITESNEGFAPLIVVAPIQLYIEEITFPQFNIGHVDEFHCVNYTTIFK